MVRYLISAGVVLSLVIGSSAVLMEERLAGVRNSVHTPISIATNTAFNHHRSKLH